MHERIVVGVLSVVAKRESSFVGFRVRESGARVIRFGLERRAAVHGIRRKGAVVSEGAMAESCCPLLFPVPDPVERADGLCYFTIFKRRCRDPKACSNGTVC